MLGELEIDIGFTGTRNAVKQLSVSFDGLKFGEGLFLSGVKGDFEGSNDTIITVLSDNSSCDGGSGGSGSGVGSGDVGRGRSGKFFAAIFLDAKGEKKIGGFGDWI